MEHPIVSLKEQSCSQLRLTFRPNDLKTKATAGKGRSCVGVPHKSRLKMEGHRSRSSSAATADHQM